MTRNAWSDGRVIATLVQVGAGECSEPLRADRGRADLILLEGRGRVLIGDVWLEVNVGDRMTTGDGDVTALRADDDGPAVAVFLQESTSSAPAAMPAAVA